MRKQWRGNESVHAYFRIFLEQGVLALVVSASVIIKSIQVFLSRYRLKNNVKWHRDCCKGIIPYSCTVPVQLGGGFRRQVVAIGAGCTLACGRRPVLLPNNRAGHGAPPELTHLR